MNYILLRQNNHDAFFGLKYEKMWGFFQNKKKHPQKALEQFRWPCDHKAKDKVSSWWRQDQDQPTSSTSGIADTVRTFDTMTPNSPSSSSMPSPTVSGLLDELMDYDSFRGLRGPSVLVYGCSVTLGTKNSTLSKTAIYNTCFAYYFRENPENPRNKWWHRAVRIFFL